MRVTGKESVSAAPELVLRGKVPVDVCGEQKHPVLVHVLWGRYGEDGYLHEGFGLQTEDTDGTIRRIPDLSTDAQEVVLLADRMNRCRVSRYHIDDVVEDFLAAV